MKKKFIVQAVEGDNGLEILAEPTVGRRVYQAGDLIEVDTRIVDVVGLVNGGFIREAPKPPDNPIP